jgi:hypothetical protein
MSSFEIVKIPFDGNPALKSMVRILNRNFSLVTSVSAGGFEFPQFSPASTWTIAHNLGFKPAIQTFTAGGAEMIGQVVHVSDNVANVYFDNPVEGYAVCR